MDRHGEQLKVSTGINMLHIPFSGMAQIAPELITGRIDVAFLPYYVAASLAESCQVRVLANLDPERINKVPPIQDDIQNFRRAPT